MLRCAKHMHYPMRLIFLDQRAFFLLTHVYSRHHALCFCHCCYICLFRNAINRTQCTCIAQAYTVNKGYSSFTLTSNCFKITYFSFLGVACLCFFTALHMQNYACEIMHRKELCPFCIYKYMYTQIQSWLLYLEQLLK